MKLGADIHFVAVFFFIISLVIQVCKNKEQFNPDSEHHYWHFKINWRETKTFSILLCAYNFSFIEFPLYHSLGKKRTP